MYLGILAGDPEEDPVGPGGGERGGGCQGVEALQGQDEQQREEGGEVFVVVEKIHVFLCLLKVRLMVEVSNLRTGELLGRSSSKPICDSSSKVNILS